MFKLVDVYEAVGCIKDGDTVAIGGAGAGHAVPDRLLQGLGEHYIKTGGPRKITALHPCGIGDNVSRGMNHLAHEGLIDTVIGGFWGNAPKMVQLALDICGSGRSWLHCHDRGLLHAGAIAEF